MASTNTSDLAQSILTEASTKGLGLPDQNGLQIFKLPMKEMNKDAKEKLRRYSVGSEQVDKEHRYMLMTGMTGSGKSLLINTIANHIYGITISDTFRLKVIVDSDEVGERSGGTGSKAESMTSWVTCYTFHWQEGFGVPYSLTIIDTPGFGDTRGLEHDESIVGQIRKFYNNPDLCPTTELSCIGLVIQGSQARITEEQKYIFGQVLNLFGKDMKDSIFVFFTYADKSDPPALEVIKSNEIPFKEECIFKFNNYATYEENEDMMVQCMWDFGKKQLQKMFDCLEKKQAVDLRKTKQVLHDREQLRLILDSLTNDINKGMIMLSEIEDHSKVIIDLDGTIDSKKCHKIKTIIFPCQIVEVHHEVTNCIKCLYTCHDPCGVKGDLKNACSAMGPDGMCLFCPGKCSWEEHKNGSRTYRYDSEQVEHTIEEMAKNYSAAVVKKNDKKHLLQDMIVKYHEHKNKLFQSIRDANKYSNLLKENALRYSFLTNIDFIDRLIYFEERSSTPNKKSRLNQLRHMKQMAEVLRDTKKNAGALTSTVSDYEKTIMAKVESIKSEDEQKPDYVEQASTNPGQGCATLTA